jgi:arylformamidase
MSLIDITRPLHNGIPSWPEDVPFRRDVTVRLLGDRRCRISSFSMSAHAGTHLDLPAHLAAQGGTARTVESIDLQVLVGPARVVDARGRPSVTEELIHALQDCPPRVLLRTDNSERDYAMEGFVALAEAAAEALVSRACLLLGIDGPSVDTAEDGDLPVHRLLLDAGVALVEGLDLSRATPGDYELICLPLPLEGSDGAPVRALLRR